MKWTEQRERERERERERGIAQDVSRLVDVCRQSLVFRDAAGLAKCLQIIRDDPDVVVVRVKNRLDPDFDSSVSAG